MDLTLIQKIAVMALPLIFAITLHEVAHGWVASWCGDQTARLSGRLSFNPLRHIDWIGTILVPLLMFITTQFIFGWAKPVPVDARNMRSPRFDMALVSAAGPIANIIMAFLWGFIGLSSNYLLNNNYMWLGLPLSHMSNFGIQINVILAALNLLPIPPLDGGHFVASVLPPRAAYYYSRLEPYGFFILVILILTGLLNFILTPIIYFMIRFIVKLLGL